MLQNKSKCPRPHRYIQQGAAFENHSLRVTLKGGTRGVQHLGGSPSVHAIIAFEQQRSNSACGTCFRGSATPPTQMGGDPPFPNSWDPYIKPHGMTEGNRALHGDQITWQEFFPQSPRNPGPDLTGRNFVTPLSMLIPISPQGIYIHFRGGGSFIPASSAVNSENKNLCGRDGRTICGPQCVPKSTDAVSACRKVHVCHCNSLGGAT